MIATKLKEAGVDWLTATSQDQQVTALMTDCWWLTKDHAHISREDCKPATWQGYIGERTAHAFFGERADGACVVLGGPLAASYAHQFLDVGARPSRLDLQITGETEMPPGKAVEQMFKQACAYTGANGRPPDLKMFVGRDGPEGLYIGRRSSELMLRIYDKGRQSRQREYRGCVRFEVELKADTARRVAGAMLAVVDEQDFISGILRDMGRARGVSLPFDIEPGSYAVPTTVYRSSTEAKMAWLLRQVSPTVQAMMEEVGRAKVISALFPDALDVHAVGDIIEESREVVRD